MSVSNLFRRPGTNSALRVPRKTCDLLKSYNLLTFAYFVSRLYKSAKILGPHP